MKKILANHNNSTISRIGQDVAILAGFAVLYVASGVHFSISHLVLIMIAVAGMTVHILFK